MAVKTVLKMGDPRLLRLAKPVETFATPALRELLDDLFDTMRATDGVGIAAPQIGVDLQVVIFGFEQNPRYPDEDGVPETVLINPVVLPLTDEEDEAWEGCLSVPGLRGLVPRPIRVRYSGFDFDGNLIDREVDGFHARVVQHEYDHLIGRLYPTRMRDLTKFGYTEVLFPDNAGRPE